MYVKGLNGFGQDDDGWDEWGYSGPVSLPSPSDTGPTAGTDWTGIFKTALTTYGDITKSEAQMRVAQPTPQTRYLTAPAQRPVYSPFTGVASGAGGIALALAAIGGVAWLALK